MDVWAPSLCQGIHRFTVWLKQVRSKAARVTQFNFHCPAYSQAGALTIQQEEQMALMGSQFQVFLKKWSPIPQGSSHLRWWRKEWADSTDHRFLWGFSKVMALPLFPREAWKKTTTTTLTQPMMNSSYSFPFKLLLPPSNSITKLGCQQCVQHWMQFLLLGPQVSLQKLLYWFHMWSDDFRNKTSLNSNTISFKTQPTSHFWSVAHKLRNKPCGTMWRLVGGHGNWSYWQCTFCSGFLAT